ncbi:MAG: imidazolonepropionase [Burkholderiaceae bacterium]
MTGTSLRTDNRTLWRNARLASFNGPEPWGWIQQGALITEGERIVWVGEESQLPAAAVDESHDLGGAVVTPGLIDCHTHLVYGGQRAREFEQRLEGASYEEIARAGGGIRSTVAATRAASEDQLLAQAQARLDALLAEGVTTVEVKSGYGLSLDDEARCLRVARRLQGAEVRASYLGAHALPPEFQGRQDDYVDAVCAWMPELQAAGLVDAVDAFCEGIGFTPAQTRRVFDAARRLGLPVKLHAEQLSDQGGTELACEFGALSCDHLEHLSPAGVQAMAASGTVAVLLPGAYYFLRETKLPPVAALREAGVPIAISTDHNPGTSPALSLLLMLNMACTLFRLTPEESLRGVTVNAARALGLADRGRLAPGLRADFCIWAIEHPNELAYYLGRNPLHRTVRAGRVRA